MPPPLRNKPLVYQDSLARCPLGADSGKRLHYLPTYSPECNPVERVWWRLHEAVTRNHRGETMEELLDLAFDWFETRTHFRVRTSMYTKTA
ncbi:MAG: transposase [Gemmataceae bacterium]